jgi:hypothetical protein
MRRCACLACLFALLPALLHADDVILKGGGKVSGRILSRTATSVEVDVGAGTVTVAMSSVVRIDARRSVLDDYYERAEKLAANDRPGWLQLAKWASSQGLGTQARTAYEHVLELDPGNVEANQGLGRVQLDGRWVTEAESYAARGFVQFEGEWMTAAERDAILRQRADAEAAELARLDAERRAQEAEARAADAEARARAAETAVPGNAGYPMYWGGWGPGPPVWPTQPIAPVRPSPPSVRPPSRPPNRPPSRPAPESGSGEQR